MLHAGDAEVALRIRRLTEADIPTCIALAGAAGWPSDDARWRGMLALGEGIGAALREDGSLVGCVIVNRFDALAMIGMMLVAPEQQRRGIGARIMEHALARAGEGHGDVTVCLFASDMGRPLYARLGFVARGETARLEGRAEVDVARYEGLRPARAQDLPAMCALDEAAQGVPRHALIAAMMQSADRALVIERSGAIVAFGMASVRDGRRIVAPLVAREDDDARALASRLVAGAREIVRIDTSPEDGVLVAWGRDVGLDVVKSLPRMVLHGAPLPGDRRLVRAIAGRPYG